MSSGPAARREEAAGRAVAVVHDRFDDHAVTAAILDCHNPAAGLVVVHPTPGHTNSSLAVDILLALGHDVGNLAAVRIGTAAMAWIAVTAWCDAAKQSGALHLVVLRGHLLTAGQLDRLTALNSAANLQMTVIWHHPALPRTDLFGQTSTRWIRHSSARRALAE